MSWDIRNRDFVLLRHLPSNMFVGIAGKLTEKESEIAQIQVLAALSPQVPIDAHPFELVFPGNLILQVVIVSSSQLVFGPSAPVAFAPYEPEHIDLAQEWKVIRQADLNQEAPLQYGVPVFILKRSWGRFLTISETLILSVAAVPVSLTQMDPFVFLPTFEIFVCINPGAQQCHSLEGTAVSHSLLLCKTDTQKENCDDPPKENSLICRDDEGHPVFQSADQCHEKCRTLKWTCVDQQCQLQWPKLGTSARSVTYDECLLECSAAKENPNPRNKTTRIHKTKNWVLVWVLALTVLFLGICAYLSVSLPRQS